MIETSTLLDNVLQSRSGGRVERCHTLPHHGSYSNAMHQWGVAMLMHYLWPEDFPRLALVCLSHDVPESWIGDIPATVLRHLPGLRESLQSLEGDLNTQIGLPREADLDPADYVKLKACDRLELYLWLQEELASGNVYAGEFIAELEHYLDEAGLPGPARALYKEIQRGCIIPRQAGVVREVVHGGE